MIKIKFQKRGKARKLTNITANHSSKQKGEIQPREGGFQVDVCELTSGRKMSHAARHC